MEYLDQDRRLLCAWFFQWRRWDRSLRTQRGENVTEEKVKTGTWKRRFWQFYVHRGYISFLCFVRHIVRSTWDSYVLLRTVIRDTELYDLIVTVGRCNLCSKLPRSRCQSFQSGSRSVSRRFLSSSISLPLFFHRLFDCFSEREICFHLMNYSGHRVMLVNLWAYAYEKQLLGNVSLIFEILQKTKLPQKQQIDTSDKIILPIQRVSFPRLRYPSVSLVNRSTTVTATTNSSARRI